MLEKVNAEKALNLVRTSRKHGDLEFLISRWRIESHIFVAAWGEFGPTFEDVLALAKLPLFRVSHDMGIILDE